MFATITRIRRRTARAIATLAISALTIPVLAQPAQATWGGWGDTCENTGGEYEVHFRTDGDGAIGMCFYDNGWFWYHDNLHFYWYFIGQQQHAE